MATFGKIPQGKKIRELESAYYRLFKDLSAEMLALEPGEFNEIKGALLMGKTRKMVEDLNHRSARWAMTEIPAAYRSAQDIARKRLNTIGAERDPRFDDNVHKAAWEAQADGTMTDLLKANASIETTVAQYLYLMRKARSGLMQIQAFDLADEEVISALVDEAIKKGQSRGKLQELIRMHFKRELYERKWIRINGRSYDLIKYARLVARTRIRKIQSDATINSCREFDNDLVEVSDHNTETEICKPFEGQIYSLNGTTPGYDILSESPPYHPNCFHFIRPTTLAVIRAKERRAA